MIKSTTETLLGEICERLILLGCNEVAIVVDEDKLNEIESEFDKRYRTAMDVKSSITTTTNTTSYLFYGMAIRFIKPQ